MAKRSRGAVRPGQTQPTRRPQRPAGRPATAATESPRAGRAGLDNTPVGEVDLDLPVEERAPARARRERARVEPAAPVRVRATQTSSLLAARAAEEYGYVARDIRHIIAVGGGLTLVLVVLFVLIDVLHVITL